MSKKFLTPVVLPADPVAAMEAATKQYVDSKAGGGLSQATADSLYVNTTGDYMTGVLYFDSDVPISWNGAKISGDYGTLRLSSQGPGYSILANHPISGQPPTDPTHYTTKDYVDSRGGDSLQRATVRAATTANITLSGTQTVDGVALVAGDRVLVRNQTTTADNGIYVVAAGAWARASDANTAAAVARGSWVKITEGNAWRFHMMTQLQVVTTLGTDAQAWRVATFVDQAGSLQAPNPTGAGHLFHNQTNKVMQAWDTAQWQPLDNKTLCTSTTRPGLFGLSDGHIIYESDTGATYILSGGAWKPIGSGGGGAPVGTIDMWPVTTPPAGYLICNGSTFSSVTYPDLATLLGDTYGTHSGTNYYLPDFRGRSPIGTGTPSPDDGSGYAFSLGQKFGESRHTQTVAEMPSHAHIQNVTNGGTQAGGPFWANGTTIVQWSNSAGSSGVPTTYIGGGSPANVTHTILGINFIIRAVQSSDPTVSGAASYTVPVPAMTAGTWLNITHSLGTEDVGVWVKEAASKENVNVDWKVVDLNTVALRSHSDVATNFLTAVVKK